MKKAFIVSVFVLCVAVILSSVLFSPATATKVVAETEILAVSDEEELNLLGMLNKNYVYGLDFDYADNIVECSFNALKENIGADGFIENGYVVDFVNDMYGIEIVDLSNFNAEYGKKDGAVFADLGFTEYKHSNIKTKLNEDGTVTATTDIAVTSLDGDTDTYKCTTLFVKNENSKFGYNIVTSEIVADFVLA